MNLRRLQQKEDNGEIMVAVGTSECNTVRLVKFRTLYWEEPRTGNEYLQGRCTKQNRGGFFTSNIEAGKYNPYAWCKNAALSTLIIR